MYFNENIEFIKCPYCDKALNDDNLDDTYEVLQNDEDEMEIKCHSCECLFKIILNVETNRAYWVKKIEQPIAESEEEDLPGQNFFPFF